MKKVLLSDICETGSGGTPSRSRHDVYYEGGTIPWVKSGELATGQVIGTEEMITEQAIRESSAKLLQPGGLLLAMYGATVGQVARLRIAAATNQAVCHIRPDPSRCDTDYLYWFLVSSKSKLLQQRVGGGQPNISQAIIRNLEVPLPDRDQQLRIATILDKADAIRRKRQQALRLTDEFLRSVFLDMFEGYLDANASERFASVLAMPLNNGFFAKNDQYGSGTPVIWVDNLYHTSLINTGSLRRAEMTANDLRKYMVLEDDLLFTRSSLVRDGIGQCNVVPKLDEPMTFECHIIRARIDPDKAHPRYIQGLFRSAFGKSQILRRANTATMTTISQGSLEDLPCPLPPLPLQKRYAELVKAAEKGAASMADTVASTNDLFSSLQQRAFSGQL